MPDTTYRVIIDLATTGDFGKTLGKSLDDVGGKTAGIEGAFRNLTGAAGDFGSSLSDAFTGAVEKVGSLVAGFGKLAGAAAIGAATYGVVGFNNEMEKTQIGLATVFTMFGATGTFNDGLNIASDTMSKMRTDAAKLPGEFQDLKQFFSLGLAPGLQAGANVDQLRQMASGAMAAAAALQVPMDMAAREYGMLLAGRAGAHNIFGAKLGLTGTEAQRFNKESAGDRVKELDKKLNSPALKSAIDAYSSSFDGISSTLIDSGKKFLGSATSGLFEKLKGAMAGANTWIDNNQDKLDRWGQSINNVLSNAFDSARDAIDRWYPSIKSFAENAYTALSGAFDRFGPVLDRVGASIRSALADPATIDKIGSVLQMYAGLKIAGVAAPAIGAMMPGGEAMGGLMSALGAGGAGLAVTGPVAAASLVGLAVAATGLYGAIDDLTDANNKYYAGATHDWQMAIIDLQAANKDLSIAFGGAGDAFKELSQWMGSNLLAEIHICTNALSEVASAFANVSEKVRAKLGILNDNDPKIAPGVRDRDIDVSSTYHTISAFADEAEKRADKKNKPPSAATHVHVGKVEITVSGNAEPSRVARGIFSEMSNLARNPKVSRFVPNYSANR